MDKLPDTIDKILQKLAERFGTTGHQLWQVLVQQAINESRVWIWCGWAFGVAALMGAFLFIFGIGQDEDGPATLGILVFFAAGIVALIMFTGGYLGLYNPDYYALSYVLSALK